MCVLIFKREFLKASFHLSFNKILMQVDINVNNLRCNF